MVPRKEPEKTGSNKGIFSGKRTIFRGGKEVHCKIQPEGKVESESVKGGGCRQSCGLNSHGRKFIRCG